MEDLIKRSDALEVAYRYCPDDDGSCSCADRDLREMLNDIENIPSADRPRGEWINKRKWANGFYERGCSICGAMKPILMHTAKVNFCSNCGARMKGADDE